MKTYRVLSIRQPWAHLIIEGIKPIENRTWLVDYRGPILIHASRTRDPALIAQHGLDADALVYGAVIGRADLIDIVEWHASPFYVPGNFAWVLANPHRIKPIPLRGRLRLFSTNLNISNRS
ncbi:ASCH domain-containing protein [Bradyrhizobium japonicum]|uniref:ASCH domain-containing protein n=1 Tax=Bradyrhizobium japonicum TaxID=375 RepID=UPI001E3579DE|nr:ASCH domain-containing protein [Bradyrhizobium japonicum]MCD9821188.1 ASCH domain-containing protein [Bradyrhizobium japonicum]MEB2674115.1 ASCH domain-containing protein [Bradyrhizobium japonicum]WRI93302.1 ASCH domain-containing protein [Bradyrhizobium japonicum]